MSVFTYDGIDSLMKQISGAEVDKMAPKMLQAGSPVLERAMHSKASKHNRTGEMERSIKPTSVGKTARGYSITIRPTGMAARARQRVRNMAKLAYMTFGTRKQRKTPVIEPAINEAERECVEAMQQAFNTEIERYR